jgi:tetratricopeptide (TPR) repeat protein
MKKDHAGALEWVGCTYEKKNMLPQAVNSWNTLLRVPELPEEKRQLAQEHITAINIRVQYGANVTPEALVNAGKKCFGQRQYDRAGTLFMDALSMRKDYPEAIEWVAYTYEKKGMLRHALAAWNALTEIQDLAQDKKRLAQQRIEGISKSLR